MYANEHEGRSALKVSDYYLDPNADNRRVLDVKLHLYKYNKFTGRWNHEHSKYKINYLDPDRNRNRILMDFKKHDQSKELALRYATFAISQLKHAFDPRGCSFVCQRCGATAKDVHHAVGL